MNCFAENGEVSIFFCVIQRRGLIEDVKHVVAPSSPRATGVATPSHTQRQTHTRLISLEAESPFNYVTFVFAGQIERCVCSFNDSGERISNAPVTLHVTNNERLRVMSCMLWDETL